MSENLEDFDRNITITQLRIQCELDRRKIKYSPNEDQIYDGNLAIDYTCTVSQWVDIILQEAIRIPERIDPEKERLENHRIEIALQKLQKLYPIN